MIRTPSAPPWYDLAALLDPAGLCADPLADARALDWLGVYRLAAAELVAPGLYGVLAARGRLDAVPAPVRAALAELHRLNAGRNARLRVLLRETVQLLNAAGIVPILLKGAIALLPDQYPQSAARMMIDLDLAVPEPQTGAAAAALRAAGYDFAPDTDPAHDAPHQHHLAALFQPGGIAGVEIHRALFTESVPSAALSLARVQAGARILDWDGCRVGVPALEHRLLHNALHHQLQDRAFYFGRCSLRSLLEFAYLRASPGASALDWPGLLRALDRVGTGDAVRAELLAVRSLFGQPLPDGVRPTAAARRAERRAVFRLNHPRWGRWRARLIRPYLGLLALPRRLRRLPRCLLTPTWYSAKVRYLRRRWFRGPLRGD